MIAAMKTSIIDLYTNMVKTDQGKDNLADRENIQTSITMIFPKKTYSESWFTQVVYQA